MSYSFKFAHHSSTVQLEHLNKPPLYMKKEGSEIEEYTITPPPSAV
jgi:hypothetical protein